MKQLVIIPGGFHPFHLGHKSLYDAAKKVFPRADIYIAATSDTSTRPFPFDLKKNLAYLGGIPKDRFIEVKSPFQPREITQQYDPDSTVLIYVRSEKDRGTSPQPDKIKKNGEPSYLQSIHGQKRGGLQPLSNHGYMAYLPTISFASDMSSSTEIRNSWPRYNNNQKSRLIKTLYPATKNNVQLKNKVVQLFDQVLDSEQLSENLGRQPHTENNSDNSKNNIRIKNRKDGFTLDLYAKGDHIGQYTHTRNEGDIKNFAEIFPEYRKKGYGSILLLAAIKTAENLGMNFEEDSHSLTPAMSRVYDELWDNGLIYGVSGIWTITPDGEDELQSFLSETQTFNKKRLSNPEVSPDYIDEKSDNSEVVQEIFDRPGEIKKTNDEENFVRYDGLVSGEQIVVFMKELKENLIGGYWKIEFKVGGRQDARGDKAGDEIAIFSTVFSAIKQFIQERKPEMLVFTALKKEFGQQTNRTNLYKRMVDRFANKYGYLSQVIDQANDSVFALKRADTVLHNTGTPSE